MLIFWAISPIGLEAQSLKSEKKAYKSAVKLIKKEDYINAARALFMLSPEYAEKHPKVYYYLAQCYASFNEYHQAKALIDVYYTKDRWDKYDKGVNLVQTVDSKIETHNEYVNQAILAESNGEYKLAQSHIQEAIKIDSTLLTNHALSMEYFYKDSNFLSSITKAKKILYYDSLNPAALQFLGLSQISLGDTQSGLKNVLIPSKHGIGLYQVYHNIGWAFKIIGENKSALIYLDSAITANPRYFRSIYLKSDILTSMGEYAKARRGFEEIINYAGTGILDLRSRIGMGICYYETGMYPESIKYFEQVIDKGLASAQLYYWHATATQISLTDELYDNDAADKTSLSKVYALSSSLLDTVLAKDPNHTEALFRKAQLEGALKNWGNAIGLVEKLISTKEFNFQGYELLSELMRDSGIYFEERVKMLKKAATLMMSPKNTNDLKYFHTAKLYQLIYIASGDKSYIDKSEMYYKKQRENNPDFEAAIYFEMAKFQYSYFSRQSKFMKYLTQAIMSENMNILLDLEIIEFTSNSILFDLAKKFNSYCKEKYVDDVGSLEKLNQMELFIKQAEESWLND